MTTPAQIWTRRGTLGRPARGNAAVGSMASAAVKDVVVTLDQTMPNTGYTPVATLSVVPLGGAATLLAAVAIQGVVAQTVTTVTVRVRASASLSSGVSVNVVVLE